MVFRRTDSNARGWLIIYHGVRMTPAGCLCRLGLALLDLDNPLKVIRRGDEWIFGPNEPYERIGDVGDVVFPCGATHNPSTGELRIYYGAADTSIALASGNTNELLDWLKKNSYILRDCYRSEMKIEALKL